MSLTWAPFITRHGTTTLCAKSALGRWDGDDFGNEWTCGYSIVLGGGDDPEQWTLWEDDGAGNGDFLGEFPTVWEAAVAANAHDADPFASARPWADAQNVGATGTARPVQGPQS